MTMQFEATAVNGQIQSFWQKKIPLFAFIILPSCFAQANPMEYFYEGKEVLPDFAALAVLESQHCPKPLAIKNYRYNEHIEHNEYAELKKQICTSQYKIGFWMRHQIHSEKNILK